MLAKVILLFVVAAVVTVGYAIRPQTAKRTPLWQLAAVFAIGLVVGAVLLTTHSLYVPSKA